MSTVSGKDASVQRRSISVKRLTGWRSPEVALGSLVRTAVIIAVSYVILRPIASKIATSVMQQSDIFDRTVQWIARNPTLENYKMAFRSMDYLTAFGRSTMLVLITGVLQLMSCTVVGYGLARFDFPLKNLVFGLIILVLLIPPHIIMIPMFLNFRFFSLFGLLDKPINLIGTYWPFILTSSTATAFRNGLFIYIMRQIFRGMPSSLEEAAYVDGASPYRAFFSVMLPNAKPGLMIVFLFSVVWQWNDIFYTGLYLKDASFLPNKMLGVTGAYVNYFVREHAGLQPNQVLQSFVSNAAMVMFIAPVLILYAVLQKYFVESVERTGLVE